MKIREMMSSRIVTVSASDSVEHAEQLMDMERIRHLPVVDGDLLVGVLSQRDVLAASMSSLSDPDPEEDRELKRKASVAQIMHGFVETVRPDTQVDEAAD